MVIKAGPKGSAHTDEWDTTSVHSDDDQVAESPGKTARRKRAPTETLAEVRMPSNGEARPHDKAVSRHVQQVDSQSIYADAE